MTFRLTAVPSSPTSLPVVSVQEYKLCSILPFENTHTSYFSHTNLRRNELLHQSHHTIIHNYITMYTSIKTLAAAVALPLVAALPVSQRAEATFDSTKPFTLHTEVANGTSALNNLYLTPFHVGAAQNTIVGSANSSQAIGWSKSDRYLFELEGDTNNIQLFQTRSSSSLLLFRAPLPASHTISVFLWQLPTCPMHLLASRSCPWVSPV